MSNIYPIGQTCQYLVSRAAKNRRAGKYDQAMKLLSRARKEFPENEEVEFEAATIYDEIGCEEEASRAYLRVVRIGGAHRAQALFQLSITSAQHGDLIRAQSYFRAFSSSDKKGVSPEMSALLKRQLEEAMNEPKKKNRVTRAKQLEKKAVQQLHAGRVYAAMRNTEHSIRLKETPQRLLLKACCHLLAGESASAEHEAKRALALKPVYVQALCVLADAYIFCGNRKEAGHVLIRAAKQANSTDSLFSTAVESAKYGYDRLTLILTRRILKREPYHIRAMAMRACAMMNLGSYRSAEKLFARLSAMVPDGGIYDAYRTQAQKGISCEERSAMAHDVTMQEAMDRSLYLLSVLQEEPSKLRCDEDLLDLVCRNSSWAITSAQAGANITLIAIIILAALDMPQTRAVLYDALLNPRIDDTQKRSILQAIGEHCSEQPLYADLYGEFSRITAGASVPDTLETESAQIIVQMAADALITRYPDAGHELLNMWITCMKVYGPVKKKDIVVCAAALEFAYHMSHHRDGALSSLSERTGYSRRLIRLWGRRILRCSNSKRNTFEE